MMGALLSGEKGGGVIRAQNDVNRKLSVLKHAKGIGSALKARWYFRISTG